MKHCKPVIDNGDGTLTVTLTQGQTCIIDKEDAWVLEDHSWSAQYRKHGDQWEARASGKPQKNDAGNWRQPTIFMHRLIRPSESKDITADHIDRNPLNNRRSNLRLASKSQQKLNSVKPNKHGWIGVVAVPSKTSPWQAQMCLNGRPYKTSVHKTPEEAAKARDQMMHDHFIKHINDIPPGCDEPDYNFITWNFPISR